MACRVHTGARQYTGRAERPLVMFRVPVDADAPTFDQVTKVGFFKWLTSSKAERSEWMRRRNAAAQTAAVNQRARASEWAERKRLEQERKRQA